MSCSSFSMIIRTAFQIRCGVRTIQKVSSQRWQSVSTPRRSRTPPTLGWTFFYAAAGAASITTLLSLHVVKAYAEDFTVDRKYTDTHSKSTIPLSLTPPPQHDTSEKNIEAAKAEFVKLLGTEGINEVPGELRSRSSSDWSPSPTSETAALIVFPTTTEHVSQVMKICFERNIPVTPFSGGTSLDGALAATRGGICLDFSKMNKVIEIHKDDLDVIVGPAVGWQDLNKELEPHGFFFPVDPGPGAQIGGMIATGCSGTNAYRYGPMKDWVVGVTVVLADGTVVKTRRRPRKSTAGYDLTRLVVGSSGTLGIVTEATLKLAPLPPNQHVAVAVFPTTHKAVNAVIELLQSGIQTEAIEFLDGISIKAVNESGYTDKQYKESPTLFLKLAGSSPEVVQTQISAVLNAASKHDTESFEASGDPETVDSLWSARKTALWSLLAQKEEGDEFLSADVAVPISRLADAMTEFIETYEKAGLRGSILGHVGDGNFHASVLYGKSQKAAAEAVILETRRRGYELDGTITGEHGIGLTLRDLLTEELGVNATDMMRRIKLALDPKCLLACDKVIRMEAEDRWITEQAHVP